MDVLETYKKYSSFKGRAARKEYNLYVLFVFAVIMVIFLYIGLVLKLTNSTLLAGVPVGIFALLLIAPNLGTQVRRFHDHNMTGWFVLLMPLAIGLILFVVGFTLGVTHAPMWIGMVVNLVLNIAYIVFMMGKRGTIGPNKYGADPLEGLDA